MQNWRLPKYIIMGLCLFMIGVALWGGQPSRAQDRTPAQKIEAEDGRVIQAGTWLSQAVSSASGGNYLYNVGAGLSPAPNAGASEPRPYESALVLQFTGPSLEVIYVSGPSLGTLAIEVDGTVLRTVITTAEIVAYGQVAKIDYLTDEAHELKVYAQGGGVVAIDAFVVATSGTPVASGLAEVAHTIESDPRFPLCDPTPGLRRVNLVNSGLGQSDLDSARSSFSGDGRYVIFGSEATNLVVGDTNGYDDVFVRDQQTCQTQRISIASDGTQGNANSSFGILTSDGRYAFFESNATNLVPNDTNGMGDIFRHDRLTGETILVSLTTAGTQLNQFASLRDISADGRFVLILTTANNLDPADSTEINYDYYLRDRQLNTTTRLTPTRSTNLFDGEISDDGRYLAFTSVYFTPDLYYCYFNACSEVYWYDRLTNETVQVARTNAGDPPSGGRYGSGGASISPNGRYVVFHSDRNNLDDGVGTACNFTFTYYLGYPVITVASRCNQIYVFDSVTLQNTRLTLVPHSHQAGNPTISNDGRYVSYEVKAIDARHVGLSNDGYVLDRNTGVSTPIGYGSGANYVYQLAPDGSFVAFQSASPDLVAGDTNGASDIFVEPIGTGSGSILFGDKLALFRNDTNSVSLIETLQSPPPPAAYASFTINPDPNGQNGRWVMGDWDGDGDKTPGTYANGAFFFTNDITPNPTWLSVWIGLIDRPPVAGRFNAAVNHDCVGAVDSAEFPPYGTAFALYFTCDLTDGTAPALTFQWLSVVLPDSGGFSGTHQFAAGDFDNNGVDSIAVRRGEFIAFGNVPPTTLLSEFNLAQYWGVPANTGGDYGLFLAGDFDNGAGDSFGVHYQNGNFYYRNSVDWAPGLHSLQQVGQPIGTPVQAASWR